MPKLAFLWIIALFPDLSFAQTNLSASDLRCVFRKPLEVGASVTARVGEKSWFRAAEKAGFNLDHFDYRGSPSQFFLAHYRAQDAEFAGPEYQSGSGQILNLAYGLSSHLEHSGSGQIENMLSGDRKEAFDRASIVVGVDLMYWDAIWNLCGYGEPVRRNIKKGDAKVPERMDAEYQLARLISAAKRAGKVLVLGKLPFEDPDKVMINSARTGVPGFWYPQHQACVRSLNRVMTEHCRDDAEGRGCYLVPVDDVVAKLNKGEKIFVSSLGVSLDLYGARPDGVHLSYGGSRGLAELMIERFEQNPPRCQLSRADASPAAE